MYEIIFFPLEDLAQRLLLESWLIQSELSPLQRSWAAARLIMLRAEKSSAEEKYLWEDTFDNVRADSRLLYVQISLQIGVQTNVQTQVQTNGRTELSAPGTKRDVKIHITKFTRLVARQIHFAIWKIMISNLDKYILHLAGTEACNWSCSLVAGTEREAREEPGRRVQQRWILDQLVKS